MCVITDLFDFVPFGDHALLINVKDSDLSQANARVIQLFHFLENYQSLSIKECIPAYDSLTILYEPSNVSFEELSGQLTKDLKDFNQIEIKSKQINLPICYDKAYSLDLEEIQIQVGLSKEEIIKLHKNTNYKVFMTGFMPGFIYLGELPASLQVTRKPAPRKEIPPGSVGLAGKQTGIYSIASPGGWQIIGRSINILDNIREGSLEISIGDEIRFFEVSKNEIESYKLDQVRL